MLETTSYRDDYETEFDADFGYSGRGGFADELSPAGLAVAYPAEIPAAVLAEIEADRAVQAADDSHRNELAAAYSRAKTMVGAEVHIKRTVEICDYSGRPVSRIEWTACIGCTGLGAGAGPDAAVDAALVNFDRQQKIAPSFGGFTVAGLATVLALPHRSQADALAMVRRIAADTAYLTAAIEFQLPGIIDERPAPVVIAVA